MDLTMNLWLDDEAETNDVLVKVYDKIFELQYNDRCLSKFAGKKLLRIEVSLKREAFLEKLSLERGDTLYDMLKTGYGQAKSVRVCEL